TQRPPLVQNPVDFGGQVTREATLLFGQSKPARDEKVFLRFRALVYFDFNSNTNVLQKYSLITSLQKLSS
ncbi:hypothetical protein T637_22005, partial [Enterobacter hormaechei subsp. hoffmannii]|uniref:hypothetical protein n=1 Tax=Enterobacter hormaechei TaxID=158836 RepID=UPI000627700C